ncbi:hypothetical protein [Acidocella aquatica]|uniref:hypothetical protein n=1 Tax=Acidocella aquatica TaxID=1922313 RepID=UPI0024E0CD11|nr:hypothetical protein [Acidocella aquatica]
MGQYVAQGVEELHQDKLARLLELRYPDAGGRHGGVGRRAWYSRGFCRVSGVSV